MLNCPLLCYLSILKDWNKSILSVHKGVALGNAIIFERLHSLEICLDACMILQYSS